MTKHAGKMVVYTRTQPCGSSELMMKAFECVILPSPQAWTELREHHLKMHKMIVEGLHVVF